MEKKEEVVKFDKKEVIHVKYKRLADNIFDLRKKYKEKEKEKKDEK